MFGFGPDPAIESNLVGVVGSNFPMMNRQSLDCNPIPKNQTKKTNKTGSSPLVIDERGKKAATRQ